MMETVEQVLICPACGHKNPESAKFCQNDGYPLRDGDPDDPLVGRLVGNYRLLQRKGEGGFGVVYLAEHNNLKTKYAVKILHPQFSANRHIAERFRREALAAGKMRHEHVVSIADFDQAQGIGYYYVMEYLEGKTLKSVLDDGEEFSPARILHVARQVTSAMERVHSLNIVHRDLKPENIFLVEEGGVPDYVKLVDFGIAKIMGEEGASLTRTGLSVGTPLYMSPEQARGNLKGLDHRTDIYSWGIILFEMLTYRPPFFSENPHEVVMMQIREIPPRLFEVCPDRQFSPELEALIQRVLAKDPTERPSSMLALYEELEDVLSAPDAVVETGMTQVMEKREEWVAASAVSLTTPTATQSTREILDDERSNHLETTGEQLIIGAENPDRPVGDSSSTTDEGQKEHNPKQERRVASAPQGAQSGDRDKENTLRNEAIVDEDTPDWRAVFPKEGFDASELPDTSAGQERLTTPELADPSRTAAEPSVDVNVVSEEALLDDAAEIAPDTPLLTTLPAMLKELPPPQPLNDPVARNNEPQLGKEPVLVDESLPLHEPTLRKETPPPRPLPEKALSEKDEEDLVTISSFSTDPDALRSPFQRFGVMVVAGIVVFMLLVAGFIYMLRKPEDNTKIDYQSLLGKVQQKRPDPPQQPQARRVPVPRQRVAPVLRKSSVAPHRVRMRPVAPVVRRPAQGAVPGLRLRVKPARKMVSLTISARPASAVCYYREGRERWREMDDCRLQYEVGDAILVRVVRRGYYTQTKTWLPKKSVSWYIRLKRRGRRRFRARTNPRPRVPPRPRPTARGDSIFEQADNPFRDKKDKK